MTDWIKQKAAAIKETDARLKTQGERALDDRRLVDAGWHDAWEAIKTAMRSDIAAFNQEFGADAARHIVIDSDAGDGFWVKRSQDGKVVVLQVGVNPVGVRLRRIVTPAQREEDKHIEFNVSAGKVVGLRKDANTVLSPSEASKRILEGLF